MITSNQQYYLFFFFLFWVLPAAVLAQSNLQVSDFNGDGHPDTLRWEYSGGSNFGGFAFPFVRENLRNGKNTTVIAAEPAA